MITQFKTVLKARSRLHVLYFCDIVRSFTNGTVAIVLVKKKLPRASEKNNSSAPSAKLFQSFSQNSLRKFCADSDSYQ